MWEEGYYDEENLAKSISEAVVKDTKFCIAMIGLLGGIMGCLLTLLGNVALHWFKENPQRQFDNQRIILRSSSRFHRYTWWHPLCILWCALVYRAMCRPMHDVSVL